jgi:hypothetical protein
MKLPFNETIKKLSLAIHLQSDGSIMPALADALEEAGCTEDHVLAHLRRKHSSYDRCFAITRIIRENNLWDEINGQGEG